MCLCVILTVCVWGVRITHTHVHYHAHQLDEQGVVAIHEQLKDVVMWREAGLYEVLDVGNLIHDFAVLGDEGALTQILKSHLPYCKYHIKSLDKVFGEFAELGDEGALTQRTRVLLMCC